MNSSRIILAMDGLSREMALEIMFNLQDHIWGVKFNDLLLKYGVDIIRDFREHTKVMVDPKLYDIPNTICNSVKTLVQAGAEIVTIHATAEYNTDEDLKWYRKKMAGVTRLTSMSNDWVERIYNTKYGQDLMVTLAHSVVERGWKYLVCSAEDLARLKLHSWFGPNIQTICPSIALPGSEIKKDDQRKRITPYEAGELGADYMVVGRAILKAGDPLSVAKQINEHFAEGKATWEAK